MPRPALHLAVEIDGDGAHPAAWRRAAHAPGELLSPRRLARTAAAAENAGFALVTLEDSILPPGSADGTGPVGRIGAVERAAFAAASTSVLGVAPVLATTYAEPFHVSSQLASLDHVSAGRAGWVVGAEEDPAAARAWGRPVVGGADAIAREARDGLRVVRDLWDSWEDDAVIRSVATSRYLDRSRLHYVDFEGETYSVKGPSIVPRPPQGRPVVLAPAGLVPAELTDVALVGGATPAEVGAAGAAAGAPLAFAEVEVALDTPRETARERIADLERYAPWEGRPDRLRYTGPAAGLVELLAELGGHVDGVRLRPLVLDEDLSALSRLVLPELFVRRLAARPLPGTTLRASLGLPRPLSRFTTAGTAVPAPEETR
ncbi:monooxygenase [Streptomyces cinereoruber]|uniref:LLM class flavin-dependent oxidoreductase n=1 Tax=Streptomyces cinereoruber TaxID=67260 RepID=A0AAV4KH84_9ACTN|nr:MULTISPECIES: LLM class flavin-dependent oxidoreductase [Streptomyces]AVH93944.1 LLM class flavin-dependent oxidoreductase [Streptomyces sp. WAC00288]KYG51629.1 nitrilotriacetate monooxygenase [Streptomyces sp. WAC04657]MBB4161325.1 alkanesulfonate monooxygenase SsuD/methylene tetrahydromethanopterin reductase-like flavin-dependent oxidoreductase (luciferase family) [Streptomyces cinereoruber]MBY8819858.1 LLM class flavin-dependent oxidoreductase [Streptomyces cinereoruber]NIH63703.1 alkane